jgi:ATP:cob(I)alamin adenosyltransferase
MAAAQLHVARAVSRRAERTVAAVVASGDAPDAVGIFLNRLSDYLFVAARFACAREGRAEGVYAKGVGVVASSAEALAARRAARSAGDA